jgi:anti-anti-sigma factor
VRDREEAFRVTVSAGEPGETRIAVQGELDSAQAQQLADAYTDARKRYQLESTTIAQDQAARIILDLEGMAFIDSGALRTLIIIQREAERNGVRLEVIAPPDSVTQLLDVAGVGGRMNLVRRDELPRRDSDFLERVEFEFEANDRAPARARAAVRESLGPLLSDSALTSVVLMTSELVTNGIVHCAGGLSVGLRLTTFWDSVRVEVDDPGDGFDPSARSAIPDELSVPDMGARGLFVVDQCATRWGARQANTDRGRRFSVWFELEIESA